VSIAVKGESSWRYLKIISDRTPSVKTRDLIQEKKIKTVENTADAIDK